MFSFFNAGAVQRLVSRLRGRSTLSIAHSARLTAGARVYNMGPSNDDITIDEGSIVRGQLLRFAHGGCIAIGKNCYVGDGTRIWSGASINIGDHVLIAHNVSIFDNLTHPMGWRDRRDHFVAITTTGHPVLADLGDRPVVIENDVWIGAHALVLRGVTIGARSVVAAGAVVTRDVAADTLVAGNPAKPIRQLDGQGVEDHVP